MTEYRTRCDVADCGNVRSWGRTDGADQDWGVIFTRENQRIELCPTHTRELAKHLPRAIFTREAP